MKKLGIFIGKIFLCGLISSCSVGVINEEKFTVFYESEYGTVPESFEVTENNVLTKEQLPVLEEKGYTFGGWYIEETKIEVGYIVLSNITLTAKWTVNTDTAYKVIHYQQNIDDDEYSLFETEEKSGTTGSEIEAIAKEYVGFVSKDVEQGTILADGSTEIKVYYDRKIITLSFDSDGGSKVEAITGKYGTSITTPENPTKEGYSFVGWNSELPKVIPDADASYKAKWTVNTDTAYKVIHYQQNIDDDEYRLFETEKKSGTTGSETEAIAKEYVGFVSKDVEQGTILADGSTEIKVYYDRKIITLSFDCDGGCKVEPITGKYGTSITTPENPTKQGYSFMGWDSEIPKVIPDADVSYKAKWTVNTDTAYKVIHYQQNIEDDEYSLFEIEEKSDTTGSETEATAKEYIGFVSKDVEQGTILADGSTEIKVYYDRKIITFSFDSDGGCKVEPITGKYGTPITTPENPTKQGYSFIGWNSELPKTMPAEDVIFKARWQENSFGLMVKAPVQSDIPNLAKPIILGAKVTFVAPEEYTSYSWYIDGVLQNNEHAQMYILDTTIFVPKSYYVMLVVTDKNNNVYSAQYELEVTK